MTDIYGFKRECETRLSKTLFSLIIQSFDFLPIAARIGANFCVHGGISPRLKSEQDIQRIIKLSAGAAPPEDFCLVIDLLWSDPSNSVADFGDNPRGCGVLFGEQAVRKFRTACPSVGRVIRSHESCSSGYEWPFLEDGSVLTVFSSCDYCEMMNDAAVAAVNDGDLSLDCAKLSPLREEQMNRRRVTFPEWALEAQTLMPEVPGASLLEIVV